MKALTAFAMILELLSYALMAHAPATKSVRIGKHPYLVLILHVNRESPRYYSGTLLSPSWVLTLSEDLYDLTNKDVNTLTVFGGMTRFADINRAPRRTVAEFYKIPNEGKEKYPAMLLLNLGQPFQQSAEVRPVQVNSGEIGKRCAVVGWATPQAYSNRGPELVQVLLRAYNATQCSKEFNTVSYESQMCGVQSYEYSFLPGSALLCSGALTAVKSIDTYLKYGNTADRVILYVRVKTYTTWMRSHVLDMGRMVYLKGSRGAPTDDLTELWERHRGSKRTERNDETGKENSAGNSRSAGLTLCYVLVLVLTRKLLL